MSTDKNILKRLVLPAVLLFLFLPLIQNTIHFKKWIKPLKGAYVQVKDTSFNWKDWFTEDYQQQKNKYLNQNFGLRNYCVLLNNQLDFSLFKKVNTDHVVVGKSNVLFEDSYINAYNGVNFSGEEKLKSHIEKLKKAQELLKNNNVDLEIIFLPGKASYFPEYFPGAYSGAKKLSNYDFMSTYAKKVTLDFVDFNAWFLQLKNKTLYDLYPTGGIHWSNYGSLLAIDSLIKRVESKIGITMRKFIITDVHFSDTLVDPDNDIGDALNLLQDIKPLSMPYAKYYWDDKGNETKPKALFIGDSYFWNWYYQGFINNMFSNSTFWYYNQTVYPETEQQRDIKKLHVKEEILKNRVIVLMATESNIQDIGWGFADIVISAFENYKAPVSSNISGPRKEIYIRYFKTAILNTPDWLEKVKVKAKEKNISVEEMLSADADYIYETEYNTQKVIDFIEQTKERIKKDEKWFGDIKRKAKEKNISAEEMLELDAKYVYDLDKKAGKI